MSIKQRPPIVGIPACIKMLGGHPYHAAGVKYVEAIVSAAGCTPLVLPALGQRLDLEQLLELVDGLLLTGSASNVAPEMYGQTLARPDLLTDTERDATTFPLIRAALAAGMPLLGICRGFQELNVAMGGSLHQEVHAQPGMLDHRETPTADLDVQYGPAHPLRLTPGGLLQELLGGAKEITVNSLHGQGIDRLGDGLAAEATAPDGLIEAVRVEGARAFALAVQWHPEWRVTGNPQSMAIFRAFGRACVQQAANRRPGPAVRQKQMVKS
ncbi:MAG: gamma-glutamyl-gamma-aminobutyrate hydrolase family protein [Betaproteobacteria bacterium]|nr:gamma-glutamyl-gamma-aminobutyrate hydrolase family protein [Betaproteobacteria bacterium]